MEYGHNENGCGDHLQWRTGGRMFGVVGPGIDFVTDESSVWHAETGEQNTTETGT